MPLPQRTSSYDIECYDVQIEDMNSQSQMSAAQQLGSGGGGGVPNLQASAITGGEDDDDDDIPDLEAVEEDGTVDETGVDPKDIDLVIQQVGCSRAKAVKVLKESGGDLINASTSVFTVHEDIALITDDSHGRERVTSPTRFTPSTLHCSASSAKTHPHVGFRTVRSTLHTCLSALDVQSTFPTSQLHVIVRPLPAVLHYLYSFCHFAAISWLADD